MRTSVALSILVCAVAAGLCGGCHKAEEHPTAPPPEVLVAPVLQQDVPVRREWIGSLDGYVNAKIRAQVSGYLQRQAYREGARVRKGELLFEIDPRPFQAALDQAQARLGKTELDVKRLTPLAREEAVSRQELDDAVQANLANKAAAEATRLNLGFTKIASPLDGIAGIATAQIGDLVGPASGDLTTVSTLDPIKAYFTLSEQEYLTCPTCYADESGPGSNEATWELELVLANGSLYPHKGKLFITDRQVDVRTGTIRLAGLFPNPGDVLRPGQFARVRAVTQTLKGALLVPQRAVAELQGTYQVVVVGADNKAIIRPVTVGERVGGLWVISSGVKAGESVVVEGIQKARQGVSVSPKPYAAPASKN